MTSGIFHVVPLGDITIRRDVRQRRELTDIDVLADSIRRLGLIHPIVVTRELELVAGERRVAACRRLGWVTIAVQYVDELDPGHLRAIELEENIKRKDIDWRDQVQAIEEYHKLRLTEQSDWSKAETGTALGLDRRRVDAILMVAEELGSGNKLMAEVEKFSTAEGIARRAVERRDAQTLNKIKESFVGVSLPEERTEEGILT